MATIVTRAGKGSPLTNTEVDSNFTNLNTDKLEKSGGTMTGDLTFGDNDKAIFGDSSDLQIYHDGSGSYVDDQGTGGLILRGTNLFLRSSTDENYIGCIADGTVTLYYDQNPKLATTNTGIDVTGTVTADGLTVDGSIAPMTVVNGARTGLQLTQTGGGSGYVSLTDANEALYLRTTDGSSTKNRIFVGSGGDIYFYEDTGTTAKFFWDASAESLGIGTSSPSAQLHLQEETANTTTRSDQLRIQANSSGTTGVGFGSNIYFLGERNGGALQAMGRIGFGASTNTTTNLSSDFIVETASSGVTAERMRINSSGNVGIGTSSPSSRFHSIGSGATGQGIFQVDTTATSVSGNTATTAFPHCLSLYNPNNTQNNNIASLGFSVATTNATSNAAIAAYSTAAGSAALTFHTESSNVIGERMRIDSSGNLLVGQTSASTSATGTIITPSGKSYHIATSDFALALDRKSTDGTILEFRKDQTVVGSITANSGSGGFLGIKGGGSNELLFPLSSVPPRIQPSVDNSFDIGTSSNRFDDIYATNGTIQTSDRNEKQDIEELSEAEQRVAVAAKSLMRKFRWKDAVAEKGDDARIHFGIIAQDLQDAFAAEGLDAGRYAMFISSTWWETQTEVPAVEAVEAQDAVYDDEGNLVSEAVEAVEAKEAYTRTDTYDTAEEAPEGATERTRLGVRYPELLAFIIAAI